VSITPSSPTLCSRVSSWSTSSAVARLFVLGSVALGLREAIDNIPYEERNEESIDSLLDDYCVGAARPISYH
jgi:hypothetical protein